MDLTIYAIITGAIHSLVCVETTGTLISKLVHLIHTNDAANTNGTQIAITSIALVLSLTMVLICGLLIVGAKKRRRSLIAPWLFLQIVGISCGIVALIIQGHKLPFHYIFRRLILMAFASLICYPVYRLWKELQFGDYTPLLDYPVESSSSLPQQQQQQQPPSPNNTTDAGSNGYQRDHFESPNYNFYLEHD